MQLPLPKHISAHAVIQAIDPAKDVDGFHAVNAGRLATGQDSLVPCTPMGSLMLIQSVRPDIAGLEAVVVGRSNIVGRPMAQLLISESCTVTVGAFEDARPARGLPPGRHPRGGGRQARDDPRRLGEARRDRDRRRHQPRPPRDGKSRLVGDVNYAEAEKVAGAITRCPAARAR